MYKKRGELLPLRSPPVADIAASPFSRHEPADFQRVRALEVGQQLLTLENIDTAGQIKRHRHRHSNTSIGAAPFRRPSSLNCLQYSTPDHELQVDDLDVTRLNPICFTIQCIKVLLYEKGGFRLLLDKDLPGPRPGFHRVVVPGAVLAVFDGSGAVQLLSAVSFSYQLMPSDGAVYQLSSGMSLPRTNTVNEYKLLHCTSSFMGRAFAPPYFLFSSRKSSRACASWLSKASSILSRRRP